MRVTDFQTEIERILSELILTFYLTERDFSYYNMEQDRFVVDGGEYEIQAGASSRDILLTCRFHMDAV